MEMGSWRIRLPRVPISEKFKIRSPNATHQANALLSPSDQKPETLTEGERDFCYEQREKLRAHDMRRWEAAWGNRERQGRSFALARCHFSHGVRWRDSIKEGAFGELSLASPVVRIDRQSWVLTKGQIFVNYRGYTDAWYDPR